MGKRTSDFVAFATILGGVGVGYGVTSLFAGSAPVPVDRVSVDAVSVDAVSVDAVSVVVRILPGRILERDRSRSTTSTFYARQETDGRRSDAAGTSGHWERRDDTEADVVCRSFVSVSSRTLFPR